MIYNSHKIELRPTPDQEAYLMQLVGATRFVYNYFLNEIKEEWAQGIHYCGKAELQKRFVALRKSGGYEWLLDLSSSGVRCAVQDLDTAYQRAFNGSSGFPVFKRRGEKDTFNLRDKTKFKINGRSLKIEKLKTTILMRQKIRFEGNPKSMTISRKADNWFVSIMVEVNEPEVNPTPTRKPSVGVDLGIKNLAVLSDGTIFEALQPLKKALHKLARLQKKLAGQVKGSNRSKDTKRKIAKCYYYIAQKRKDVLHRCGAKQKMPLKVRVYDCPQCGLSIDRDLNAAININKYVATNLGETLNAQGREMHRKGAPDKDPCEHSEASASSRRS